MAAAKRMPKTPMRGRAWFALGLMLFMVVTAVVIWRRSEGVALGNTERDLQAKIRRLESARIALENDLREASSRKHVVAEAERRLSLHVAGDAQTRTIADADSVP